VTVRRRHRADRLGPPAAWSLASYLAGGPRPQPPAAGRAGRAGRAERAALLTAALEALSDLRGSERDRLTALLDQLGFVSQCIAKLAAGRRAERRRAAESLSAIGSPAAVPALTAGLNDRDVLVRTTCARALAEAGDEELIPVVAAAVARDARRAPGASAVVVLAVASSRPEALGPLLRPGAPAELRAIAITVVGELRLAEHALALRDALADGDVVAAGAARGLGMIGEFGATGALARLALDEQRPAAVRAVAVTALGSIGSRADTEVLEHLIAAADWPVQAAAAGALARLGPPGMAALHRAATSGPRRVRELAEAAAQP
jgi:HEAT repeat protein